MPARVAVRRDGFRFELDAREEVQRQIYFGAFERRDVRRTLAFVPPGATALDVGANVGYYSLVLAERVGPGGRVHAFEPDPRLAEHLERHLALNGFADRVHVHRTAVAAAAGRADFLRAEKENLGGGTLIPYPDLQRETFPVEVVSLDGFCDAHGVRTVDFLKVDVEGAETDVLRGAGGLLERRAVHHILVELNGWRLDDQGLGFGELAEPLFERGYVLDPLNGEFL
jgi:FkbM family methyltransferase